MKYRVVSIPEQIADEVRVTRKSPQYNHPAYVETATGYGPCRACLRTFDEGKEERILFTYNPFEGLSDLPAPGPVFIHKDKCESYDDDEKFPEDLRRLPLLFEGFGDNADLIQRERVVSDVVENQIGEMLALQAVNYINIRNADAGCFVARIERATSDDYVKQASAR